MRGKYDVDKKMRAVGIKNCCISEITVAELLYGAECSGKVEEIKKMVIDFCDNLEVVPIADCLVEFARQKASLRQKGTLIDDFDLLIASSAIANNYVLVTDNLKHFNRVTGLTLCNWIDRSC